MKKIVAILLLVIYGVTTVGATIHIHYCMNKRVGWDLCLGKSRECPTCGMDKAKSNGCCRDEVKCIQVRSEHQQPAIVDPVPDFDGTAILQPLVAYSFTNLSITPPPSDRYHAPPLPSGQRLHVLHCVFII
jgi:hypothetical protein